MSLDATPDLAPPLALFRYHVAFSRVTPRGAAPKEGNGDDSGDATLCQGSFSECTGLEATMEPKVIKAGGANYGAAQRVGPVSFGTVILKRGMTTNRDLWTAFSGVSELGFSAVRFNVAIAVQHLDGSTAFTVRLTRALPVKFKCGDLSARATEIGIEELHLVHEGLSLS